MSQQKNYYIKNLDCTLVTQDKEDIEALYFIFGLTLSVEIQEQKTAKEIWYSCQFKLPGMEHPSYFQAGQQVTKFYEFLEKNGFKKDKQLGASKKQQTSISTSNTINNNKTEW